MVILVMILARPDCYSQPRDAVRLTKITWIPASSNIFIARVWSLLGSIESPESAYTMQGNGTNAQPTNIESVDAQLDEETQIVLELG
jgi:hypothetical protein